MVNFWSSVFVLPKAFYAKIDSLCAAFLWNNKTSSAAGARVAWKDLCRPKSEGGLGIRHLEDFQLVFRLKHVWNYFSNSGSLWASWLKKYAFRRGYWLTQDSTRFSPTVRSMIQLKPMINDFMRCLVKNGATSSFWFDTWTLLGPLISVLGENGPSMLRLRKSATVLDATREGSWRLPAARSPSAQTLQICVLCSTGIETHHHLFYECDYSSSIWLHYAQVILPDTPSDIHSAAALISRERLGPKASPVIKLILQSLSYLIWRERNARIFTAVSTPAVGLRQALDRLVRDRLISFPSTDLSPSLLQFFFACTRPP
uniref:Reverse transcriptase zinc-binding domain-containing protein n=1 Tax=Brassica campestris TaxID=3711 RepID=A0A3P6D7Q5_BRACM|nr:unnamed protein product [Brassica rapa]